MSARDLVFALVGFAVGGFGMALLICWNTPNRERRVPPRPAQHTVQNRRNDHRRTAR